MVYITDLVIYILENGIYNRPGYIIYILENGEKSPSLFFRQKFIATVCKTLQTTSFIVQFTN